MSRYNITEEFANSNQAVSEFARFEDLLTRKYGLSYEDKTIRIDQNYNNDPDTGDAINAGALILRTRWLSEDTRVAMTLEAKNHEPRFSITYDATRFKVLAKQAREAEILADL